MVRGRIKYYVLAQQWRLSHNSRDLWPFYCDELKRFRQNGGVYWEEAGLSEPSESKIDNKAEVADPELCSLLESLGGGSGPADSDWLSEWRN